MKRGQGSFSQQVNRAVPGDMSASKALCALTDQKMALACSSCRSLFYGDESFVFSFTFDFYADYFLAGVAFYGSAFYPYVCSWIDFDED